MVKKNYKCGWCGREFTQEVFYDADAKFSTPVKCFCGMYLPTWEIESTGNIYGKKHIHIRK